MSAAVKLTPCTDPPELELRKIVADGTGVAADGVATTTDVNSPNTSAITAANWRLMKSPLDVCRTHPWSRRRYFTASRGWLQEAD